MNELNKAETLRGDDKKTLSGFKLYGRKPLAGTMRTWFAEEWQELLDKQHLDQELLDQQRLVQELHPRQEDDEGDSLMT